MAERPAPSQPSLLALGLTFSVRHADGYGPIAAAYVAL